MILKNVCLCVNHLRKLISVFDTRYLIILCEEIPDNIESDTIYISGNNKKVWYLAMQCPCSCGGVIDLNLIAGRSPCWKVKWNISGTITITPSIWRTKKCKSHFFLIDGQVQWCNAVSMHKCP